MCGIAGIVNLDGSRSVGASELRQMLGAIRHRGPDEFGIYLYAHERTNVGLGSARLSIIDLSSGQQPLCNEDGTLWVVFNGEIFNYVELRQELEDQNHEFSTTSDTEVLLHLYEQHGCEFVKRLNGQFAFAIWNERDQSLFIARDRLGIRPLYYALRSGNFLFASEMKALFCAGDLDAEMDPVALHQTFTCWSPLSPRTTFQSIKTLPPGHWLHMAAGDGEPRISRYWQLSYPQGDPPVTAPFEEYEEQLLDLLVDATRIRLRADVPVGAYLSGGIDSSIIASLVRGYTDTHLRTYSIGFEDKDFDESPYQQLMAQHLGTEHSMTRCDYRAIGEAFPDVVWHTETPILRTSPVPLYLLSGLVHDHGFKVVLTGEGADEMLAGYNIFKEAKIRRFWARVPDSQLRPALLQKLYPYIGQLGRSGDAYLRQFFGRNLGDVDALDYSHQIRWNNTSRAKRFFSPELRAQAAVEDSAIVDGIELPNEFRDWSPLSRSQYLEATIFMGEYLLSSQGDRVAMAHSVEGRFPFLDHRVVEYCNQLPTRLKLRVLEEKYLLKRIGRRFVPEEVWRRPKRPYRAPIHGSFFQDGEPLEWVDEVLSPAALAEAGLFDTAAVSRLLAKLSKTGVLSETDDMALAGILSTQLLHRQFVSDFRPAPALTEADKVKIVARGMAIAGLQDASA